MRQALRIFVKVWEVKDWTYLVYAALCCPWGIWDTVSIITGFLLLLLALVILLDCSSFIKASVLSRKWWPVVHWPPKHLLWVKLLLFIELNNEMYSINKHSRRWTEGHIKHKQNSGVAYSYFYTCFYFPSHLLYFCPWFRPWILRNTRLNFWCKKSDT